MHRLVLMLSIAVAGSASAHEGHGMPGVHLHATDVLGFAMLAAAIAGAAWWRGRR